MATFRERWRLFFFANKNRIEVCFRLVKRLIPFGILVLILVTVFVTLTRTLTVQNIATLKGQSTCFVNACGDGFCQRGIPTMCGHPLAENESWCPQDCANNSSSPSGCSCPGIWSPGSCVSCVDPGGGQPCYPNDGAACLNLGINPGICRTGDCIIGRQCTPGSYNECNDDPVMRECCHSPSCSVNGICTCDDYVSCRQQSSSSADQNYSCFRGGRCNRVPYQGICADLTVDCLNLENPIPTGESCGGSCYGQCVLCPISASSNSAVTIQSSASNISQYSSQDVASSTTSVTPWPDYCFCSTQLECQTNNGLGYSDNRGMCVSEYVCCYPPCGIGDPSNNCKIPSACREHGGTVRTDMPSCSFHPPSEAGKCCEYPSCDAPDTCTSEFSCISQGGSPVITPYGGAMTCSNGTSPTDICCTHASSSISSATISSSARSDGCITTNDRICPAGFAPGSNATIAIATPRQEKWFSKFFAWLFGSPALPPLSAPHQLAQGGFQGCADPLSMCQVQEMNCQHLAIDCAPGNPQIITGVCGNFSLNDCMDTCVKCTPGSSSSSSSTLLLLCCPIFSSSSSFLAACPASCTQVAAANLCLPDGPISAQSSSTGNASSTSVAPPPPECIGGGICHMVFDGEACWYNNHGTTCPNDPITNAPVSPVITGEVCAGVCNGLCMRCSSTGTPGSVSSKSAEATRECTGGGFCNEASDRGQCVAAVPDCTKVVGEQILAGTAVPTGESCAGSCNGKCVRCALSAPSSSAISISSASSQPSGNCSVQTAEGATCCCCTASSSSISSEPAPLLCSTPCGFYDSAQCPAGTTTKTTAIAQTSRGWFASLFAWLFNGTGIWNFTEIGTPVTESPLSTTYCALGSTQRRITLADIPKPLFSAGEPSLAIAATGSLRGLPTVVHFASLDPRAGGRVDATDVNLFITQCDDTDCATSHTIGFPNDTQGVVPTGPASLAIDPSGNPVFSFRGIAYDHNSYQTNPGLFITRCSGDCATRMETTHLSWATTNPETKTILRIGEDGLPVILEYDPSSDNVRITKCKDTACALYTTSFLSAGMTLNALYSMAIGQNGVPIVAAYAPHTICGLSSPWCNGPDSTIAAFVCSDAVCTTWNLAMEIPVGAITNPTEFSLLINQAGLPVIFYTTTEADQETLKAASCQTPTCSSITTTTLPVSPYHAKVQWNAQGFPSIVSYTEPLADVTQTAIYTRCADAQCSAGTLRWPLPETIMNVQREEKAIFSTQLPFAFFMHGDNPALAFVARNDRLQSAVYPQLHIAVMDGPCTVDPPPCCCPLCDATHPCTDSSESFSSSSSNSSPAASLSSFSAPSSLSSSSSSVMMHLGCNGSTCILLPGPTDPAVSACDPDLGCGVGSRLICQDLACHSISGSGRNECGPSKACLGPVTHLACQGSACVSVEGAGINECTTCFGCGLTSHAACSGSQCLLAAGAGGNFCNPALGCGVAIHSICQANLCTITTTSGANECGSSNICACEAASTSSIPSTSSQPAYHYGCVSNTCTPILGAGTNNCAACPGGSASSSITNISSQPIYHLGCAGSVCTYIAGEGTNNCAACPMATSSSPYHPAATVCGNRILEFPESCDDGNTLSGDGCSATCQMEMGSRCGNGKVEPPEECDRGSQNGIQGSGCTGQCTWTQVLAADICGDGITDLGEECDLGLLNHQVNSGCSPSCNIVSIPSDCGNGILEIYEQCDDGNTTPGDGCDGQCRIEPINLRPTTLCGNGALDPGEECDDTNRINGDGCSASCLLENGRCGDGIMQRALGEECEPTLQNAHSPVQCGKNCRFVLANCGNGIIETGEECDDGKKNTKSPDGHCRSDCRLGRCGDGIRDKSEQCDDGDNVSGDGCNAFCRNETITPVSKLIGQLNSGNDTQDTGNGSQNGNTGESNGKNEANQGNGNTQGNGGVTGSVTTLNPLTSGNGPVGKTGPASVLVIAAGAGVGLAWMRRKRKRRKAA